MIYIIEGLKIDFSLFYSPSCRDAPSARIWREHTCADYIAKRWPYMWTIHYI